jgi:hypothetical protein
MGLDIPNSFLPLFLVAIFCTGLTACALIILLGDESFKNRLFMKIYAGITGVLSLTTVIFTSLNAFAGTSLANSRFDRPTFVLYQHSLLSNTLIGALLVILVATLSLWIMRTYSAKSRQEKSV